jgi:hypothetical protein
MAGRSPFNVRWRDDYGYHHKKTVGRFDLRRPGSEMTTINRRTMLLIVGTLALEMVSQRGWAASTVITVYKNPT